MYNQCMKKRYYVIFRGQVQGVGFRWTIQQLARRYGCTGWIRNLYSGNVDMEIQGPALDIHAFITEISKSSRWIIIDDYSCKEIDLKEDERSFQVVY